MKTFHILSLVLFAPLVNAAVQELIEANNLIFTPAIYKEISDNNQGNFLVSPFSAETVLALTQSGCKDETAEEIRKALGFSVDSAKIESAFQTLLPTLTRSDLHTLRIANKMYVKENFSIKDAFKKIATEDYQADSETIDFTKAVEAAEIMNDWVEKQTENKIKNLIKSSDLGSLTRLVLINALYFKANWSSPFPLESAWEENFYKSAEDVVQVDMIHSSSSYFPYYESSQLGAKFLELPFEGEDASMTVVLPTDKEGLVALEKQIDKIFMPYNYTRRKVKLLLPKFRIDSEIDFKKILKNLGVHKVFEAEEADLSGIAGEKGNLKVDVVRQKTFIDVNEGGIEAAAASAVLVPVPPGIPTPPTEEFIADHPFIFYVKTKGIIIFAGKVTSPEM